MKRLLFLLSPSLILAFYQSVSQSYSFTSIPSQSPFALRQVVEAQQSNIISNYDTLLERTKNGKSSPSSHSSSSSLTLITMRDKSSANVFKKGDQVKVVSSVVKAGVDLIGRVGLVAEVWEKCEVDPTCCCAEFVDENFAVTVKFDGPINLDEVSLLSFSNHISNGGSEDRVPIIIGLNEYFTHFFAEEELVHV